MFRIDLLICALILLTRGAAAAQQSETSRVQRVPVTIVLVDTSAVESQFEIMRRTTAQPLDVILLRGNHTAGTLSEAVRRLLLIRAAQGDTTASEGLVRVRAHRPALAAQRPYPWAVRVLGDLTRSTPRVVSGIGLVRAVEIWLPPQRRAGVTPPLP